MVKRASVVLVGADAYDQLITSVVSVPLAAVVTVVWHARLATAVVVNVDVPRAITLLTDVSTMVLAIDTHDSAVPLPVATWLVHVGTVGIVGLPLKSAYAPLVATVANVGKSVILALTCV